MNSKLLSILEGLVEPDWGKRCKTTDKHDFPDTDYSDPKNGRCPSCAFYERLDEAAKEIEELYIARSEVVKLLLPPEMHKDFKWPCILCGFDPEKSAAQLTNQSERGEGATK